MMLILDTNVVSELRKVSAGKGDANVTRWADSVVVSNLYLSAITIQELEIGVLLAERRDPVQGAMLRTWLDSNVLPAFTGRILSVDTAVALCSAKLNVSNPQAIRDGLITATAVVHGMTVVTRNIGDFAATGVALLNPWSPT